MRAGLVVVTADSDVFAGTVTRIVELPDPVVAATVSFRPLLKSPSDAVHVDGEHPVGVAVTLTSVLPPCCDGPGLGQDVGLIENSHGPGFVEVEPPLRRASSAAAPPPPPAAG